MSGLFLGLGSIIMLMIYSSSSERLALGLNLMSPSRSFCHMSPLFGRFIPEESSSKVAPRLKMSAFLLILSVTFILDCSSSGAM